jgi:ankyrin repeat protein
MHRGRRRSKSRMSPLFILALSMSISGCTSTVFLHAASEGDTPKVQALMASGTSPNSKLPLLGAPAILLASGEGHLDTVIALVARGADVNGADVTGWTALHAAAQNGHRDVIVYLLDHGAEVRPGTWYKPSPSVVAAKQGFAEIAELLTAVQNGHPKRGVLGGIFQAELKR